MEDCEFRVVCGKQNRLRTRRKNPCVHGEDVKTHKIVYISAYNNTNCNFFFILSIYIHNMGWITNNVIIIFGGMKNRVYL
jgi:hypothetical protein